MSWGTELWDQFDRVTDHTLRGIEFCERYTHFIKDRAKIESEYANALRKLTKSYLPRKKEEESPYTAVKSFYDSLKEVGDIAGQHELLADQLRAGIFDEMSKYTSEIKADRKRHMEKAKQLDNQLQAQMRHLDGSKKKYFRAYDDQMRAEETYRIADSNLNLSRAEVEKTKSISYQRGQFCSDCKASYAKALEETNNQQKDYYNKHLPQVFQSLQEMDENRIKKLQECIMKMSDEEKGIQPIVNTCLDGITTASQKVDHAEDSRKVIDKYQSGHRPPQDIEFEDLSNEEVVLNKPSRDKETVKPGTNTTRSKPKREKTTLGKIFGGGRGETLKRFSKASEPEKEDFSHLPPQQQKKQLKEKIKQIKHQITKERAEREGLVKMQEVYRGNPKLGDANSVNSQIEDNKQKIDGLEAELSKYEGYLDGAEGTGTPVMVRKSSAGSYHSINSADNGTPASGVNGTTANSLSAAGTPVSTRQATSHYSINSHQSHHSNYYDDELRALDYQSTPVNDSFDDDFDDVEPAAEMPIVGKATALYQFDATTAGSLSMVPDEQLSIVDEDNGDGWTRIRKPNGEEGFVPTTYIKIH